MIYNTPNMAEIVKTSNENGRRMAYSVVGNQDPLLDNPSEIDASMAERIIILTPFGREQLLLLDSRNSSSNVSSWNCID